MVEIPDVHRAGDMARVNLIEFDSYQVYCIGLEDLLIDRLNAAVHWGSREDRRWAAVMLRVYRDELDLEYLCMRACEEKVRSLLDKLW